MSISGSDLTDLLQTVLAKGSKFTFQAKGFSMSPFIKDGDMLTISPLLDATPLLGDVVTFIHQPAKRLFVHRVVGKKGDSYLIKGDSALELDCPVAAENIPGIVTKVKRGKNRIILGLGPERFLIAFLSRRNLLLPMVTLFWKIIRAIAKK